MFATDRPRPLFLPLWEDCQFCGDTHEAVPVERSVLGWMPFTAVCPATGQAEHFDGCLTGDRLGDALARALPPRLPEAPPCPWCAAAARVLRAGRDGVEYACTACAMRHTRTYRDPGGVYAFWPGGVAVAFGDEDAAPLFPNWAWRLRDAWRRLRRRVYWLWRWWPRPVPWWDTAAGRADALAGVEFWCGRATEEAP
jgi:hypothetical protein